MIAAVVLAAGGSSRLGGRPKQLLTVDGVPIVARVLRAVTLSRVAQTIVVTGYRGEEVRAAARAFPVRWLDNPAWSQGMSTSLRLGLTALDHTAEGAVIVLGDQPYLTPDLINRLIDAFAGAPAPAIARPVAGSRAGHPVVFSRYFFNLLASARGDRGGREVLDTHAERLVTVPAHPHEIMDVDTWEDLARCREVTQGTRY